MCLKAALFDLGGVVVEWDPRRLYTTIFDDSDEMEWFLAHVCTPAWNADLDRGRPFAEAVAELSDLHPSYRDHIAAYHARWEEMLGEVLEETAEILAALRRRDVPVYALSNWSAETFPTALRRFPILGCFDGIVISGEEGTVKPERHIFHIACERYGIAPEETFFVDDSPANVEAARRLGFEAHVFRTAGDLRAALEAAGLL